MKGKFKRVLSKLKHALIPELSTQNIFQVRNHVKNVVQLYVNKEKRKNITVQVYKEKLYLN